MKPFFTKKAPYKESDVLDQQAFGRNKKKPNQRDDQDRYDPPQRNDPPYRNDPPSRNDNYGPKVQYVAKEEHQDMRDSYKENKRQKKYRSKDDGQKPQVYQEKNNGNSNGNKNHQQSSKQASKKDDQEKTTQVQKIEQIQEVPLSQNETKNEQITSSTTTVKSQQEQNQVVTSETIIKQEIKPEISEEKILKGTYDTSIQKQPTTSLQTSLQSPSQSTQNQVIDGAQNQVQPPTIAYQNNGFQQTPVILNPPLQYQNPNPYGIATLPPQYFVPQQYPYGPYQPYFPPPQNDPKQTLIHQQIYLGGHLISTQFPFTEEGIQSCHKFLTDLIQNNKK